MKIDPLRFDAADLFKASPGLVLFYGSDEGLIDYFLWDIREAGTHKGEKIQRIDEAAFIENPQAVLMPDLFSQNDGRSTLIFVQDVLEKNASFYKKYLPELRGHTLVLTSPKARTSSALVQLCLKEDRCWAMGCYPLEVGPRSALFQKNAKRFGFELTPQLLKNFIPFFSVADIPQLFQKLSLYTTGGLTPQRLTLEILEACWGEVLETPTDLAYALSGRDESALNRWIVGADGEQDVMSAIRQAQRHFIQLLQVQSGLHQQESLEHALQHLSPPVFFKHVPLFKAHLRQWSLPHLMRVIGLLVQAEIAFKKRLFPQSYTAFLRRILG